jgi:XTP/dITP diphosphohydrolase
MKIVFATHNANKAKEIAAVLPQGLELLTLSDIGFEEDIPETAPNLEGNALIKARTIKERTGFDCFADDTGLEVLQLNNDPGVHSARYAGDQRSDSDNISKLLQNLDRIEDRTARFRTVIALILDGKEMLFEGIVEGKIRKTPVGTNGFGYDPIFEPENCGLTFAELSLKEKNQRSHRARAFEQLIQYLKNGHQ